ncbi:30S ribosomal protein S18 [Flavonifractor sp. An82]|nr:30S ribosomal protein S18 [Flavonifractor sp. An82]
MGRLSLSGCANDTDADEAKLRRYLSERSKILPRRTTGTCAMHQRQLTEAIKRARQIALLPFVTD